MSDNFPSIGEPVLDPSEKFPEGGVDKYDLLLADGGAVDKNTHPLYYAIARQLDYTGFSFDVSVVNIEPYAIDWDGTYFWVSGFGGPIIEVPRVWRFDSNGVYTGFYIDASATHGQYERIFGLTAKDSFLWIQDRGDSDGIQSMYYKYFKTGGYAGESRNLLAQDGDMRAIKWDGTYFWACGRITERVYQYDSDFVYTGFSFPAIKPNTGIAVIGSEIFVTEGGAGVKDEVNVYSKQGVYIGLAGNISAEDTTMRGLTSRGVNLFSVGASNDRVYEYAQVSATPIMTSPDPLCPYRIVADLT